MTHHVCDCCGTDAPIEIEVCRHYTGGQPIHVCSNCGLVYVTERRSSGEVAASWSEIYGSGGYSPAWPAVEARLTYVAEFVKRSVETWGKRIIDIGGGDGRLMAKFDQARERVVIEPAEPGYKINPSTTDFFIGRAEDAVGKIEPADVVTLTWCLENCAEPAKVLDAAYKLTKPGGHVVVATGSRILVPFKKRLSQYLSTNAADTHPTRWSANSLRAMLMRAGFGGAETNAYEDSDWLVVIAQRGGSEFWVSTDHPRDVIAHFNRWHEAWP